MQKARGFDGGGTDDHEADAAVDIALDGVEIASGNTGGRIPGQPNDPLIVGDDRMSPVGSYETPQSFRGTILRVRFIAGAVVPPDR